MQAVNVFTLRCVLAAGAGTISTALVPLLVESVKPGVVSVASKSTHDALIEQAFVSLADASRSWIFLVVAFRIIGSPCVDYNNTASTGPASAARSASAPTTATTSRCAAITTRASRAAEVSATSTATLPALG